MAENLVKVRVKAPPLEAQGDSFPITSDSTDASTSKHLGSPIEKDQISPVDDNTALPTLQTRPSLRKNSTREFNPFPYTPEKLAKLHDPKDLKFLDELGGIEGLAYGLKTNLEDGLSPDEESVVMERVSRASTPKGKERENTPAPSLTPAETETGAETTFGGEPFNIARRLSTFLPHHEERQPFKDRRRIFGTNTIPPRQPKGILQLMWDALHDKILVQTPENLI
jgi:hypothetical protein